MLARIAESYQSIDDGARRTELQEDVRNLSVTMDPLKVPPVVRNPSQNYHKSRTALVTLTATFAFGIRKREKNTESCQSVYEFSSNICYKNSSLSSSYDKKTKIRKDLNKETRCILRGGGDKSLARPTSRCRRTESIVSLDRVVCSFAELQVFSCYRG